MSKIEWTDALAGPVAALVASSAQRHDVEPVSSFVAQVMVIFGCGLSAVQARQAWCGPHATHLHGLSHGVHGALLILPRWCADRSSATDLHPTAITTLSRQTVSAGGVAVESRGGLPRLAPSACLESVGPAVLVLRKREAESSGRHLQHTDLRAHGRRISYGS